MKSKKIIRDADDFECIYLPKYHKKKMEDLETPEETGERMAKEMIGKIRKYFKKINKKSKPHFSPCKCRHRGCDKRAIYIVEDNECLKGMRLTCAEHLHDSIINAFQFNEPCKPIDDLATVRKISHLDDKLRDNYYLRNKK
jgi:hypothetical protein